MSSYGKCTDFPINLPQYGKMQQNQWSGKSWEIDTHTYSTGAFFSLYSHFTVYFITWEMHVFSHQFLVTLEKKSDPSNRESLGNWFPVISYKTHSMRRNWEIGTHTFPIVWVLFFIRLPSYVIFHHMGNAWVFSSNFSWH